MNNTTQKTNITMADLRTANQLYFKRGQKQFFGDVSYAIIKVNGKHYLRTYSSGWSDMFCRQKSFFYYVKPIDPVTLEIGAMIERGDKNNKFMTPESVKEHLKTLP